MASLGIPLFAKGEGALTTKERFHLTALVCKKRKWSVLLILLSGVAYFLGTHLEDLPVPVDKWGMLGFVAAAMQLWVDMQKSKGVKEVTESIGSATSKTATMVLDQFSSKLDQHQRVVSGQHESLRQTMQLLINNNKQDDDRHRQHETRLTNLENGQKEIMSEMRKISDKVGAD